MIVSFLFQRSLAVLSLLLRCPFLSPILRRENGLSGEVEVIWGYLQGIVEL